MLERCHGFTKTEQSVDENLMSHSILFTRQPIFDALMNTYAYELHCSTKDNEGAAVQENREQGVELLVNAFSNILDSGYIKYLPALISGGAEWLYENQLPEIPVETLLMEINNFNDLSDEAKNSVRLMAKNGYRLVAPEHAPEALIELASIVKIDIRDRSNEALTRACQRFSKRDNTKLLAMNVDSHEAYSACKNAGFDLFLGNFFATPQYVKGRKLERNEQVMFQLIGEVNHPKATPESIEKVLQSDPELVASILRLVNSAAFRGRRTISNIAEAIVVLGLVELRKWVLMFALSHNKRTSNELIGLLLIKGKMCELLAESNPQVDPSTAFLTGILSGIDAVLAMPIDELMQQLPVQVEVKRALTGGSNPLGRILATVNLYVLGEWQGLSNQEEIDTLATHFEYSLGWSEELLQQLA